MTQMLSFDLESTFREIIDRMERDGVYEHEAYDDLVEEVLEEKRETGELDDDANVQEYIEKLRHRWPEAETALETGHDQGVVEEE